ncbi:Diaminopimelate epimerase-like protein [Auricularia subglabra TFB-10046 SS5]|nr:Diaminopimelate epimerase-like protein [Auricularia subglabra TFB-10046 SS5]
MAPTLELPYTIVDAFTSSVFSGNPAAVIVLPRDANLPDATLQRIAREFNLSETAFLTQRGEEAVYGLRWFTPTSEVKLCGHATLASAHVLRAAHSSITFETRWSGNLLTSVRDGGKIEMAFPAGVPEAVSDEEKARLSPLIRNALGIPTLVIDFIGAALGSSLSSCLLVHIDDSVDLAALHVDIGALSDLTPFKVIILTNRPPADLQEQGKHFVSRVFAPLVGIPEDPVTGSAHTLPDETLQLIAREFNLAETAFVTPTTSDPNVFELRWFTPVFEMPLCGHATLASAHVVDLPGDMTFRTRLSGNLVTSKSNDGTIAMSFPAGVPRAVDQGVHQQVPEVARKVLGLSNVPHINFIGDASGPSFKGYILAHIDDDIDLERAEVHPEAVSELPEPCWLLILTNAPPQRLQEAGIHFVSRVFVPPPDVPEDPVTGSAHCMLAPYWAQKLGIQGTLAARQVSPRGGDLEVEWSRDIDRVTLRGHAVTVAKGTLFAPA